ELSGVEATWQPTPAPPPARPWRVGSGAPTGTFWLPHLNLAVARAFTAGSADHEAAWPALNRPGRLILRTKLDLWSMLRPAVQPGSRLDHAWPVEKVTLTLRAGSRFTIKLGAGVA